MRMTALSDQELIRLYLRGEEVCFEELMNRHKDRLFTHIYMLVKNRKLAEDFFHDTVVKTIHALKAGKYTEDGRFRAWMMRVAHNLVMDHFRKKQKMRLQYSTKEFDVFSVIKHEDPTREEELMKEQVYSDLRKLVELLPYDQREVLLMRIHARMSFKEISWITGVSINTALGRMRYALIKLRQLKEEHGMSLMY